MQFDSHFLKVCTESKNESFKKIDAYVTLYAKQILARRFSSNFHRSFWQEIGQETMRIFWTLMNYPTPSLPLQHKNSRKKFRPKKVPFL